MKKYRLLLIISLFLTVMFLGTTIVKAEDKYTVTFDIYNGKQTEIVKVNKNAKVSEPKTPERQGYIFAGWYTNKSYNMLYDFNSPVQNNMTLYAKWDIKKYTVRFNTNGANTIPDKIVNFRSKLEKPQDPKKSGYIFAGWYKDPYFENKFSFLTEIKGNMTLYAFWVTTPRNTYDVTFVPGLGVDPFIYEIEKGGYADSPAIDMESDTINADRAIYGKWYTNPEKTIEFDFDSLITSDITLYGKWTLEDGTEIIETADTAGKKDILYIIIGIVLTLGAGFIIVKLIFKSNKKNN